MQSAVSPATSFEATRGARSRPIDVAPVTTICGLSPLVVIPGAGTELYRGVGAIVLFGILGAAIVSVTMLPALTIATLEFLSSRGAQSDHREELTSSSRGA